MSAILNPVPSPQDPAKRPSLVPSPVEPAKKATWLIWGTLLVLIVAGIATWRWYAEQKEAEALAAIPAVRTAKALLAPLQQTVRINGVTTARSFVNITVAKLMSPEGNSPMTILQMAPSGTIVKKGQVVLEIDGQSRLDHIEEVDSYVVQSQGDIVKRQAEQALELENLVQSVRVAKSEVDKVNLDAKAKDLRTALDQELIQLSVEEANAKYTQLLKDVDFKKQSFASEMKILSYTTERHTRHRGSGIPAREGRDCSRSFGTADTRPVGAGCRAGCVGSRHRRVSLRGIPAVEAGTARQGSGGARRGRGDARALRSAAPAAGNAGGDRAAPAGACGGGGARADETA